MSQKNLFEGESAIHLELDREGDTLLITFGGIAQGIGMARFEFQRMTADLPTKLVLVRDLSQSWYHADLPDIGAGIHAVAQKLQQVKTEAAPRQVICLGNSMGGYAALLFGSMIAADQVIAFSPQTFLTTWLRLRHGDRRWKTQLRATQKVKSAHAEAFDLKTFLGDQPGYQQAVIYADRADRLDYVHAQHLAQTPRTEIRWREGGHGLVKNLRESGELAQILTDACASSSNIAT